MFPMKEVEQEPRSLSIPNTTVILVKEPEQKIELFCIPSAGKTILCIGLFGCVGYFAYAVYLIPA